MVYGLTEKELNKCSCGGKGRYRYSTSLHWVECRNKTCGRRTRYYPDGGIDDNPDARQRAVDEWNEMVKQHGKDRQLHQT